jgi:hypothetical protein
MAGPTTDTIIRRKIKGCPYVSIFTPVDKIYGADFCNIAANPHALAAKHTIAIHFFKTGFIDTQEFSKVFYDINIRASGKQEFCDHFSSLPESLSICFNNDIIFNRKRTGGVQPRKTVLGNLHHAQATPPIRFHIFVVAQMGDLDPVFTGNFKYSGAFFGTDFFVVYGKSDHLILFDKIVFNTKAWSSTS